MDRTRLTFLLHAYFSDTISPADTKELLDYISTADEQGLLNEIQELLPADSLKDEWEEGRIEPVYSKILDDRRFIAAAPKKRISIKSYLSIAASLLILISIGLSLYYFFGTKTPRNEIQFSGSGPLSQGYDHALLTLGKQDPILLDTTTAVNTVFAGARIIQHRNRIDYLKVGSGHSPSVENILTTPRGGQFSIVLQDGTKIWLNAASQLHYPAVFTGNERIVELKGEAYFEVAKDSRRPFKVIVEGTKVQVLGTHFNINAYPDQGKVETTLLEGSVQLFSKGKNAMLRPGEAALVTSADGSIVVRPVDIDQAVAWKNGLISFKDEDISAIMKKISRWYDAEIVFNSAPSKQLFGGTLNRNKPLAELLENLEILCDIKFKIEGRRIIVMQ